VSASVKRAFEARPAAVTFDCWNTLLYEDDWPAAHARRVAELHRAAAEAGHAATPDQAARAFDAAWARHLDLWREQRASGAAEVARWALRILGIEPHGIPFDHLVNDWQEASHTSRVEALAGAQHLLERLRSVGIRTALICDTGLTPGRVVRRHLDRNGLLEHLDVQVFSDEVGVPKPHPRMFRAALEPLRVQPLRSVHVGDLRRTDVAGGRGVGMGTVRLRARFDDLEALPEADAVADTHAELGTLLGVGDD
jgi:putative hydrolase of the HAD superfamily